LKITSKLFNILSIKHNLYFKLILIARTIRTPKYTNPIPGSQASRALLLIIFISQELQRPPTYKIVLLPYLSL